MNFIAMNNISIPLYLHLFKKKVNNAYLIRLIINILLAKTVGNSYSEKTTDNKE